MGILDILNKSVLGVGYVVNSSFEEVANGGVVNHETVALEGNSFKAIKTLNDNGIKAFAPSGSTKGVGWVEVHKGQKKEAIKVLRKNGYDCW